MAAIVVQFGLATMPFGIKRSACGLLMRWLKNVRRVFSLTALT